ncbi:hypothetical protein OF83DRAFT_577459 [Amylostereum chailletii]|nr:hypothetical protein OF83DRAFT_577459 [Amylostereum chailletii]
MCTTDCEACGKGLRTGVSWESHVRSKRHIRAVERRRREDEDKKRRERDETSSRSLPGRKSRPKKKMDGTQSFSNTVEAPVSHSHVVHGSIFILAVAVAFALATLA